MGHRPSGAAPGGFLGGRSGISAWRVKVDQSASNPRVMLLTIAFAVGGPLNGVGASMRRQDWWTNAPIEPRLLVFGKEQPRRLTSWKQSKSRKSPSRSAIRFARHSSSRNATTAGSLCTSTAVDCQLTSSAGATSRNGTRGLGRPPPEGRDGRCPGVEPARPAARLSHSGLHSPSLGFVWSWRARRSILASAADPGGTPPS